MRAYGKLKSKITHRIILTLIQSCNQSPAAFVQ